MSDKKIQSLNYNNIKINYYEEKNPKSDKYTHKSHDRKFIIHGTTKNPAIVGEELVIHMKEGLLHNRSEPSIQFGMDKERPNGHAYYVEGNLHSIRPETIPAAQYNNFLIGRNFNISLFCDAGLPVKTENGHMVGKWGDEVVLKVYTNDIFRMQKNTFESTRQLSDYCSGSFARSMNAVFSIESDFLDALKKHIFIGGNLEDAVKVIENKVFKYKLHNTEDYAFEFDWKWNDLQHLKVKIRAENGKLKISKDNPSISISNGEHTYNYFLQNIKEYENSTKKEYSYIIKSYKNGNLKNIKYNKKNDLHIAAEAFHSNGNISKIIYEKFDKYDKKDSIEINFDKDGHLLSYTSSLSLIKSLSFKNNSLKYENSKNNVFVEKLKEIYGDSILKDIFKTRGYLKPEWVEILEVTHDLRVPNILKFDEKSFSNENKFYENISLNQNKKESNEILKNKIKNRIFK